MTLKEFTERHIKADTTGWRKVFPTDLRFIERTVKKHFLRKNITTKILQEKWERIHKGDVIDQEWRDI